MKITIEGVEGVWPVARLLAAITREAGHMVETIELRGDKAAAVGFNPVTDGRELAEAQLKDLTATGVIIIVKGRRGGVGG